MENDLNNYEVGERIRKVRKQLLMSREKFSEMIDISEVFLGQIERGERSLSLKTLNNIVNFTGVSTDYLLYGKDENDNGYIKKINRILKKSSPDTVELIYNLMYSVYQYNKKFKNNE